MAQYDGSIRINTAIETKGLKQDITALKGKLKELGSGIDQGMAGVAGKISDVENSIKRLASGMRREISGVKSNVDSLSGSFKKLGVTIASVFAVRKIAGMANSMTELGSDLEEVQNVVDVTFTTMSDKVDAFAKTATKSAGLSETMAKRYVGTFGAMSKSFGFAEDAALGMSTTLTQLAGDVASFYNISQDEAYTKLKSVFTGETETLKDLGVVMTENALNSYAMAKGIGKTVSKMSEQQKVALRYQFVLEKLSGASGDFVRTQDSWANQTRVLKLQLESLKATIGQGLINVLNPLLKMLNTLLEKLRTVANAFKSFTESFFGKTSAGSSGAGYVDTAEDIAGSLEDVSDAAQDAKEALEGYLSPLDEINKYETGKGDDLLSGIEDIDFGKLGDINMKVGITPELDDSELSKKLSSLVNKVKSVLQRLFKPLKDFLHSGYEKIKGTFSGGSASQSYSAMPRSVSLARSIQSPAPYMPASIAQTLRNAEIPGYATGQVIPANMKKHLAYLGDNNHETEVVSPLSTIRQAQKEALIEALSEIGLTGGGIGGNNQPIIIKWIADGKELTDLVIQNGKVQQMSSGSNPFLFGIT